MINDVISFSFFLSFSLNQITYANRLSDKIITHTEWMNDDDDDDDDESPYGWLADWEILIVFTNNFITKQKKNKNNLILKITNHHYFLDHHHNNNEDEDEDLLLIIYIIWCLSYSDCFCYFLTIINDEKKKKIK